MAQIGRLKVETNVTNKQTYINIPSGMLEKTKEVVLLKVSAVSISPLRLSFIIDPIRPWMFSIHVWIAECLISVFL